VICGRIALAGQFGQPDIGERFMGQLIVTRATLRLLHGKNFGKQIVKIS
jgi:hypothetical protein